MVKLNWIKRIVTVCLLPISIPHFAYGQQIEVKYYEKDDITNQIPYFDNRFHIDAQLDEITLLFYRKSGTPPITLVRPDGSKLKINNLPEDKVTWFDDRTFDMIKIIKPMPGPWQAVGDILPNSKIMLVSDVSLKVEPLAEIVLSGETLKVIGQIYNRELVVDDPLFNDVVNLDIDFFSMNNTAFDNFGAEPVAIGSFRDDGRELDEYARDGIFTAEFTLDFSPGEWLPIYRVILPMATRELRQKPIIVRANPITIEVEPTIEPLEFHQVTLHIDDEFVEPDSLIFQGKITFPDRQVEPFAILEGSGKSRMKKVGYTEPGVHRISLSAFGKTINDREFRLVVPDFSFNVERKGGIFVPTLDDEGNLVTSEVNDNSMTEEAKAQQAEEAAKNLAMEAEKKRAAEEAEQFQTILYIALGNLVIVLIAGGLFFVVRRKKAKV